MARPPAIPGPPGALRPTVATGAALSGRAAAQAAIQEQITVATTAIAVASAERKIWQGRLCGLVLF